MNDLSRRLDDIERKLDHQDGGQTIVIMLISDVSDLRELPASPEHWRTYEPEMAKARAAGRGIAYLDASAERQARLDAAAKN